MSLWKMDKTRNIAFILLISSAFLMIVNNMRPHHHHNEVCFTTGHCDDDGPCSGENNGGHDGWDHMHGHPINAMCKIMGIYIIPVNKSMYGKIYAKPFCKSVAFLIFDRLNKNESNTVLSTQLYGSSDNHTGQSLKDLVRALRAPPNC